MSNFRAGWESRYPVADGENLTNERERRGAKRADGKQVATPAAIVGRRTRKRISVYFENCRGGSLSLSQSENPAKISPAREYKRFGRINPPANYPFLRETSISIEEYQSNLDIEFQIAICESRSQHLNGASRIFRSLVYGKELINNDITFIGGEAFTSHLYLSLLQI